MTTGDEALERAGAKLDAAAERAAARGGLAGRIAPRLADDAAFVRKLKPSLIAARLRGQAPTDLPPGQTPAAPSSPQLGPRRELPRAAQNPFVVVGAAFALGVLVAKAIDWRSHAHPRE